MKAMTPYLNFDGNCREAMTFYHSCLGGDLNVMTFGESEFDSPPEAKDRLMMFTCETIDRSNRS